MQPRLPAWQARCFKFQLAPATPRPILPPMKFIPDWKWKAALAALVLVTAAVVFWPLPDPPPPPESSLPAEEPVSTDDMLQYTVQEGDTPEAIARLFVIRLDDLMAANSMPLSGDFEPGQRIFIPPERGD